MLTNLLFYSIAVFSDVEQSSEEDQNGELKKQVMKLIPNSFPADKNSTILLRLTQDDFTRQQESSRRERVNASHFVSYMMAVETTLILNAWSLTINGNYLNICGCFGYSQK